MVLITVLAIPFAVQPATILAVHLIGYYYALYYAVILTMVLTLLFAAQLIYTYVRWKRGD